MRIAAVAVDVALPHLDRTFDYRVPDELAGGVAAGQRVRVRFAGRLVSGYVVALHDDATHATADLHAVVGPVPVLAPTTAALVRAVADRYASTFADVVRFAVPPRHARAEAAALAATPLDQRVAAPDLSALAAVRALPAFLQRAQRGEAVAACLELPTRLDLAPTVAALAVAALQGGSVIVAAPDAREVSLLQTALRELGVDPIVMQAGDGPAARQRAFTASAHAERAVVLGTRSAVFAPLSGVGTTIVVGDGSDALVEPHAPGWHAREVALARGRVAQWSTLLVGRHRSLEVQALVADGSVRALSWEAAAWRAAGVRVEAVPERLEDADPLLRRLRIPPSAFRAMRAALQQGSVLVSVPQRGYITSVRCAGCREAARCATCAGPMAQPAADAQVRCSLCGAVGWSCPWCHGTRLLHQGIGIERTREELGRAFPEVPIRLVDADHPLATLPEEPHLLLATPGSEPAGRLPLAVILDADAVLGRHDLSAAVEALRRWSEVAACVQAEGRLLVVGASSAPTIQALVRQDPAGFAERELRERAAIGLPPAVHVAVVEAPAGSDAAARLAEQAPGSTVLGPTPVGDGQRWLVLHPRLEPLVVGSRALLARLSAAKSLAGTGVRIDPLEIRT